MTNRLLEIQNLSVEFPHRLGNFTAVDDFSMHLERGEIVGLIGESGAGKSTVGNAIIRLLENPGRLSSGSVSLDDQVISDLSDADFDPLRGRRIGMVFQDPMTSLNPLLTIGDQLAETISLCQRSSVSLAWAEAAKRLADVGIPDVETRMKQYPHQFSGGMRQRVVIALALAGDPDLLIADEPTTALDVSIQKQVLDLLKQLCEKRNLGVILVTHDMGVIAEMADRVYIMRYGKLVESGLTNEILATPKESYTQQLIAATPRIDKREERFSSPKSSTFEIDNWLLEGTRSDTVGPYLTASPLTCDFTIKKALLAANRKMFRAVDTPAFEVERGEVLGLVGESGSGKSTLGRMLIGLQKASSGTVHYTDHGYLEGIKKADDRKRLRRDVQVIFQDPYSSLNSRLRVEKILAEPIVFHSLASKKSVPGLVAGLLERVGLDSSAGKKYPHQFSGGQRQRICIARALAVRPKFLLCDEPTSALDVSIQAEMLSLLIELKQSLGLTMLFVSHDLAVIRQVADRVAVMRQGKLVELQSSEALFDTPKDPYTRMLLETAPRIARSEGRTHAVLKGANS